MIRSASCSCAWRFGASRACVFRGFYTSMLSDCYDNAIPSEIMNDNQPTQSTQDQVSGMSAPVNSQRPSSLSRFVFAATITLGAFLLFSVQLLIAKYILPWFGGTAGVWATCLLFFQSVLLAGYAYAHASVDRLARRAQAKLHIILIVVSLGILGLTALLWPTPITPGNSWEPKSGEIALWLILRLLTVSVGLPVLLLATTGPLIQRWYSYIYGGESVYRLYVLSNAGSLLGLLSYPVVLERLLRLHSQAWLWSLGYLAYAVAAIGSAVLISRNTSPLPEQDHKKGDTNPAIAPSVGQKLLWVFLAALGSLMLLGTTRFVTQDLAPIPLLWMLPLAVYLASFIVCFDHPRWYLPGLFHFLLLAAVVFIFLIYHGVTLKLWTFIDIFLGILFVCCIFCHGELYRRRPAAQYLTSFYLMIALGGALGSAFVNLVAPFLFKGYWEMHIGIALCVLSMAILTLRDKTSWIHRKNPFVLVALITWTFWTIEFWLHRKDSLTRFMSDWRFQILVVLGVLSLLMAFRPKSSADAESLAARFTVVTQACLVLVVAAASFMLIWFATVQYRGSEWARRNFYSALYIQRKDAVDPRFSFYAFVHGNTSHGMQIIAPELRTYPVGYFAKNSGIGLTLQNFPRQHDAAGAPQGLRVGIIGLGVGTLATYGQPGDVFRFYELDPEVIRVASGKYGYFSYLSDCKAHLELVEGDGRISLERELSSGQPQHYDVFIIDAFNGDTIPVHLLTKEAFELYLQHLRDENSVIVVHVSNRAVDLSSVLAQEAAYFHLRMAYIFAPGVTNTSLPQGLIEPNAWVILSRNSRLLSLPAITNAASPIPIRSGLPLWTDDYSNLLQVVRTAHSN